MSVIYLNSPLNIFYQIKNMFEKVRLSVQCCNIYTNKSTVFQKCRLCTISIQTKLTTRGQGCLGNYSCVLTESYIQHFVVTCNYTHI